ncbi:MAG: carboxypeptidase-like regulatory domain-containing protein [Bacteroidota bacterium]|nr:carboxypeptidase-like regulatory domain-containing protein [Bacteroidota bacterium]
MKNIYFILAITMVFGILFFGCKKDQGTEPLGPITISGFVKDYFGMPVSGAAVIIPGKSAVTTTAAGTFSIPNVTVPYDISVVVSTGKVAMIYKGLSRPDPKLLYLYFSGTSKSAAITGSVPVAIGKTSKIYFVSGSYFSSTTADPTTGAYSFYGYWYDTSSTSNAKLFFLRYSTDGTGIPTIFDGYASKSLSVQNGASYTSQNFPTSDIVDPPDVTVSGVVSMPTGFSLSSRRLYIIFDNAKISLRSDPTPITSTSFDYAVPNIAGVQFGIRASAYKTSTPSDIGTSFTKLGINAGSTNVNVTLESSPRLALPPNNSPNIDYNSEFTWSQGTGDGVNLVQINSSISNNPVYYIFTRESNLKIPDFSTHGLGLPPNTTYSWYVYRYLPIPSTDYAASNTFVKWLREMTSDFGYSYSESFTFTTKP